jgi:methionyl-tRNA formyltransferase
MDFGIIFMGTPEFAIPSLKALVYNNYEIKAVVTQPQKPRGRGRKTLAVPVKEYALAKGLPCLEPHDLRERGFLEGLKELSPSLVVTAAYGKILPPQVLQIPALGCINVHPSLLPLYRGAAPVQRAIMAGARETGVTIYYMDKGMDTGDIILQKKVAIHPGETGGELLARLAAEGARSLLEAVALMAAGNAPRVPQDHPRATKAPPLSREDERIDWTLAAALVASRINGLSPSPGAYTLFRGKRLKIMRALPTPGAGTAGTILAMGKSAFEVAAGSGAVRVREVQPEGKRVMPAEDFMRGYRLDLGEKFNGG